MEDPILFAATVLAILAAPGPTNTLLAASGASAGFRPSAHLLSAVASAFALTVIAVGGLLGPLLTGDARTVLGVLAALYLGVLAIRLWQCSRLGSAGLVRWRHVFVATLLNPKGLVLALVVVPMHRPDALRYVGATVLLAAAAGSAWIGFGAFLRNVGGDRIRPMVPKVSSAVLAASAVLVVVSVFAG